MKKWSIVLLLILSLTLLVTACGKGSDQGDTDPAINYEDYVKPVTDRKAADCITAGQVSTALGVPMTAAGDTADDMVNFQSEDGLYMVTVSLQLSSYEAIEAIAMDPNGGWTRQEGVAEGAFFSGDGGELIAYYDGYGISVYFSQPNRDAMLYVLDAVMENLK